MKETLLKMDKLKMKTRNNLQSFIVKICLFSYS